MARVCEDGVKKDERGMKMVANVELPNPRLLRRVYRRGVGKIGRELRH
jgi:hypothetical protein